MRTRTRDGYSMGIGMVVIFVIILCVGIPYAYAATRTWDAASGDWSTAANWGGTEPGSGDSAVVANGGTANVTQNNEAAANLYLGTTAGTSGSVNQSSGTLTVGTMYVGQGAGSSGTYTYSGGTLSATTISSGGTGSIAYAPASPWSVGVRDLAVQAGGDLTLTSSTFSVGLSNGQLSIAAGGSLTLNQSQIYLRSASPLSLAEDAYIGGSGGVLTFMSQGTQALPSHTYDAIILICPEDTSNRGTLSQQGAVTVNALLRVGAVSRPATYLTNNHSLDINGDFKIDNSVSEAYFGSSAVSISGSFTNTNGTFDRGTSTVTFDATTTGKTITSSSDAFNNIAFNGVGGGWSLVDGLTAAGSFAMANGSLDTNGKNVSVSGSFSVTGGTYHQNGGTLTLAGSSNSVSGGTLQVNGTVSGSNKTLTVSDDGFLKGNSTFSGVAIIVEDGGMMSPGNSPGTTDVHGTTLTWGGGAVLGFDLYNATGTAGALDGWDLFTLTSSGTLAITATPADKITLNIQGLSDVDPVDVHGDPINFNLSQDYSWLFVDGEGGTITGFDEGAFTLNILDITGTSVNAFSIAMENNPLSGKDSLYIKYDASAGQVPEPGTVAGIIGMVIMAGVRRMYRRRKV